LNQLPRIILGVVIFIMVMSLISLEQIVNAERLPQSIVRVKGDQSVGPLSSLFRSGMFLNEYPLGSTFETFFSELKPGAVQVMPLRDGSDAESLQEYVKRLPSFHSTRWAIEVSQKGGRPIIGLTEIPKWLRQSKSPDAYLRPPKDLSGWADFVEANVRFFNNQLHLDADYVLWDEPDSKMFWKGGTIWDYFKLYRAFVLGARRADLKAKVGGPAVSWWGAKGEGSDGKYSMLYYFIRYCAETSFPELGLQRLPMDFVVWHQFNNDPKGDPFLYAIPVEEIRGWLKQFGYDPTTRLMIGSWNSWINFGKDPNELSSERDTEYEAAYVVHALDAMDRAGIQGHTFFNLFEKWQWESIPLARRQREFRDKEFFGGFGIFTKGGVIKPVFNAFKALSLLEGNRLVATSDDPYLTLIASRSENRLFLLMSNFYWPDEGKMALKGRGLLIKGYRRADLIPWVSKITPQMIQEVDAGKRSIDSLPIPEQVKKDLNALSYLDDFYKARGEPKSVRIQIQPQPFSGEVRVERYVIDGQHSNSFQAVHVVQEVALQAKQQAEVNVEDLLLQWGVLDHQFKKWDGDRRIKEVRTVLPRLSKEQQQKVEEAVRKIENSTLKQVNHAPEIRLQKIEDQKVTFQPGERIDLATEMAHYSVQLIVLTSGGSK